MSASLTPADFVEKWERATLNERAAYQSHFNDLCRMLGHATPAEIDPDGSFFRFEKAVVKIGGDKGFADVWYKGHFAIEYKGPGKYDTLDDAYRQLLQYREDLLNPPLLVVCDIRRFEVHTNFPNTAKRVYRFSNQEVLLNENMRVLRALFEDPDRLNPRLTPEQVTRDAAVVFQQMADEMRGRISETRLAHFFTRLIFCLFTEDIGLLPTLPGGRGIFTEIVEETYTDPDRFAAYTTELFQKMADGGEMHFRKIRYFDGSLFDDAAVETLSPKALEGLRQACQLNWSTIDPSIFGTLFERVLDPAKRAQLGAHYTSQKDILLIVEPVLMAPLRRRWEDVQAKAGPVRAAHDAAASDRERLGHLEALRDLRAEMLDALRKVTVLDPACGSGNFLYVALRSLLDLENAVLRFEGWRELFPREEPKVRPGQLYGIEINEVAHDLSSIVVWIGYLQWHEANGYRAALDRVPLLEKYGNIRLMDAILAFDADGKPVEPEWPAVDVIVSNPPFLGGKKLRAELGDGYIDRLYALWPQMHGESDLVAYWFEKARQHMEAGKVRRVGLLATNSIRGGANREVLNRIKTVGDIFMAWADRPWILEGAAVRVSMVGFDDGTETERVLDAVRVSTINTDLTSSIDITRSVRLDENADIAYMGITPTGQFVLSGDEARAILESDSRNKEVLFPYLNGQDVTRRSGDRWIVDFTNLTFAQAAQYVLPMAYVQKNVKPFRDQHKTEKLRMG